MDAISSIGNLFKGSSGGLDISKLFGIGAGGAGAIGNFLASQKRNEVLNQQLAVQRQLMNMTPDQLSAGITSLERPLTAGLTSSVGNAVQAYLAERGLSQAPGIQSETLAQGLAPYQLQEQQLATQAFLQKLGLPAQAAARFLPYPQSTDLSKLFQSLFNRPNTGQVPSFTSPGPANYGPTLSQLGVNPADTTGSTDFGQLTPPTDNGAFNWMDLLSNPGGLTPSFAS